MAPFGNFFALFERSIFDLNSDTPFFEILGDLGTRNEVKMVKILLKIEQNSPKIATMSEIGKVHLDLCFTYPNGSPHDQESTKIGREGSKIHENMLKKLMRQKSRQKAVFHRFWSHFGVPESPPKPSKWVRDIGGTHFFALRDAPGSILEPPRLIWEPPGSILERFG